MSFKTMDDGQVMLYLVCSKAYLVRQRNKGLTCMVTET